MEEKTKIIEFKNMNKLIKKWNYSELSVCWCILFKNNRFWEYYSKTVTHLKKFLSRKHCCKLINKKVLFYICIHTYILFYFYSKVHPVKAQDPLEVKGYVRRQIFMECKVMVNPRLEQAKIVKIGKASLWELVLWSSSLWKEAALVGPN